MPISSIYAGPSLEVLLKDSGEEFWSYSTFMCMLTHLCQCRAISQFGNPSQITWKSVMRGKIVLYQMNSLLFLKAGGL